MTLSELREACAKVCSDLAVEIDGTLPNAFGGNFAKKFAANSLRAAAAKIDQLPLPPLSQEDKEAVNLAQEVVADYEELDKANPAQAHVNTDEERLARALLRAHGRKT